MSESHHFNIGQVRKNIASINKMIAQVEVNTNVPGASVLVDGEVMGTTPLDQPLVIGAGEHRIRVSLAGYEDVEKTVAVVSQTRQVVEFALAPVAGGGIGAVPVNMDVKGALVFAPGAMAPPPNEPRAVTTSTVTAEPTSATIVAVCVRAWAAMAFRMRSAPTLSGSSHWTSMPKGRSRPATMTGML